MNAILPIEAALGEAEQLAMARWRAPEHPVGSEAVELGARLLALIEAIDVEGPAGRARMGPLLEGLALCDYACGEGAPPASFAARMRKGR